MTHETTDWEDIKAWFAENREPVIIIAALCLAIGFCTACVLLSIAHK